MVVRYESEDLGFSPSLPVSELCKVGKSFVL